MFITLEKRSDLGTIGAWGANIILGLVQTADSNSKVSTPNFHLVSTTAKISEAHHGHAAQEFDTVD